MTYLPVATSGPQIHVRYDLQRGCGWRKPGGKYLIGAKVLADCQKLPMPLDTCPVCHHGIHPSRSWMWIGARSLFAHEDGAPCGSDCLWDKCPLWDPPERAGLLWIGGSYYPTPEAYLREAARLGICRRIAQIPKGLVVGQTLILLAHREIYWTLFAEPPAQAGIFAAFVPQAIEYIVCGDETPEELNRVVKQGCTLVRVERVEGGSDATGSEGARPGLLEPGAPAVRPAGHGTEDREPPGGDTPGAIV